MGMLPRLNNRWSLSFFMAWISAIALMATVGAGARGDGTTRPRITQQLSGRLGAYSSTGRFLAYVDTNNVLQIDEVRQRQPIDLVRVERLLTLLDSERFHERNEAFVELKRLGSLIQKQIDARQALGAKNSLEVQERLKALEESIQHSALSVSTGSIRRLAISPNEELIAVGGNDRLVTLWRSASRQQESIITAFDSTIHSLAFSSDSNLLAIGTGNGGIFLYDIQRQLLSEPFLGHDSAVLDLEFAPDHQLLYSAGGSDKRIGVWSVANSDSAEDRRRVTWLKGHQDVIRCLAVSPDGNRVVSGGYDRDLIVWDVNSNAPVRRLQGHTSTIRCIAFVGEGTDFLSASDDGTIRRWNLSASHSLETIKPGIGSLQRISKHPREESVGGKW